MAAVEANDAPYMTLRRAAERRSKHRMSEQMDVRVRCGRRSASTKGSFDNTTFSKPSCPAQWFWRLLPKQKSPARGSERNQTWMSGDDDKDTGRLASLSVRDGNIQCHPCHWSS